MTRRRLLKILAVVPFGSALLAACGDDTLSNVAPQAGSAGQTTLRSLPKKGKAPEWDNSTWLNSEKFSLNSLQGKVVLVEFWTFGCYNCQNVMPSLKGWYEDYKDRGFEIIAMHAPEFDYEKKLENVQQAIKDRGLKYPVAIDNDFTTWNKFGVRAWPTLYLLDKQGYIRYNHIGEGAYDQTRAAIETLLAE
jgi:thiol-disulfide isomerase/thioredoxin